MQRARSGQPAERFCAVRICVHADEDLEGVLDFRRFTVLLKELAKAAFPTMSPEDAHARLLQVRAPREAFGSLGKKRRERPQSSSARRSSPPFGCNAKVDGGVRLVECAGLAVWAGLLPSQKHVRDGFLKVSSGDFWANPCCYKAVTQKTWD